MTDAVPGFTATAFAHEGREHEVYWAGAGPAVIVIHEMPGLHPGVTAFGQRLVDAGFTVYMPSLFGRPGELFDRPRDAPLDPAGLRVPGVCPAGEPDQSRWRRGCGRSRPRRTPSAAARASGRSACASLAGSRWPWRWIRLCSHRCSASRGCPRRSAPVTRAAIGLSPADLASVKERTRRRAVRARASLHRRQGLAGGAVRDAPAGSWATHSRPSRSTLRRVIRTGYRPGRIRC